MSGHATAAVVGGGPAGLAAAEVLARGGVETTVFEAKPTVGRKLLLAGRSGLNLTHGEPTPALLARYGPASARLAPAIEAFDADALRAWAEELGQATFVGTSGRVFPEAMRATPLLRAWLRRLADLGVEVRVRHRWTGWEDGALRFEVADRPAEGTVAPGGGRPRRVAAVRPDVVVLALGGASWPRTGSDGAWVAPLEAAGVPVAPLQPANAGVLVAWTPVFADRFAGTPLKDVVLRHGSAAARGDPVVTAAGLEGGPVYALTASLRDAAPTALAVDAYPDASAAEVERRLARRRAKDSAATGLARAGVPPAVVGLLREATGNRLPSDAASLARLLKGIPVPVTAIQPVDRAISTAGGVRLDALDDRFMLRARPGTFVAGEMLDWEAPTGGYLLQACFSTGVAAAEGALGWLSRR